MLLRNLCQKLKIYNEIEDTLKLAVLKFSYKHTHEQS